MNKTFIKKIKEKLETEKASLESELEKFAIKDEKLKGDWDTKFPDFQAGSGSQQLEEAADEVEEYVAKLPVEHSLETRLRDIDLALQKIAGGKYGQCEKCGKEISKARLEVAPEAKTCAKCQ